MARIEFNYAGETYSIDEESELLRAIAWDNGKPIWSRVLRATKVSVVTIAVDACVKEIILLRERVEDLEAKIGEEAS